jgi:[acyl-carrier-protein] S-malonyltransferase
MAKTLWMFPGQGSQAVGMTADLLDSPAAQAKLAIAADILGWSVVEVCNGDEAQLSQTQYTQPCLYTIEAILADALKAAGKTPDLVAGHSLGEYVALYAAGAFSFEAGLRLVKRRAELMQAASGGKMAAMIGFDRAALTEAIAATEGVVLANDNSDAQVVISGTPEAVDAILANVKAKRAVPLAVSGAFHSPYMAEASADFNQVLAETDFADTAIAVLSNTDPTPETSGAALKDRLSKQMTGSVRWRETMEFLNEMGCTEAIEVGPGKVLTGLLKRACPNTALVNVSALAEIA